MFEEHRRRFLDILEREGAAALVLSGTPSLRNGDSEHRFRPRSDFFWLTGFAEPEAALVLTPRSSERRATLFLRDRDRNAEIWSGRRLGVEAAPAALGVDEARPIEGLWDTLPELLRDHRRVCHGFGEDPESDARLSECLQGMQRQGLRTGRTVPREWIALGEWLHELRLVKDSGEIDRMRRAAQVSAKAHRAAMAAARPGVNEREIDALLEYTFRRAGGTGSAYTNIVAGGANACILHYVENDAPLADGDLLLIDAGCEWDCYASDVTRTFPVSGRFGPQQRQLYEVVLRAQREALALVAPGNTHRQVHDRAVEVLVQGLLELGLLKGRLEDQLEGETYRRFYMHRTGHWLGLDVHDCGAYYRDGAPRPFEPGMVTTVEPGLYIAPDDDSVEPGWRGIGIRIEDDVLVTPQGHEVLSADVPTDPDEIEAACRKSFAPVP